MIERVLENQVFYYLFLWNIFWMTNFMIRKPYSIFSQFSKKMVVLLLQRQSWKREKNNCFKTTGTYCLISQKVLLPLRLVTKLFDQKTKPTLALAIPSLLHLKKVYAELDELETGDAEVVRKSIVEGLNNRLISAVKKGPHWMSALFDPPNKRFSQGRRVLGWDFFFGKGLIVFSIFFKS